MTPPILEMPDHDALSREARDWLRRLTAGTATTADVAAMEEWRGRSSAHARAFAEAALLWETLGIATEYAAQLDPGLLARVERQFARARMQRRAFLAGGGALTASVAGLLAVRPPLGLWSSVAELGADYRTHIGQQQQIRLAGQASVNLNTRTSILVRTVADGASRLELVAGEAAVAVSDERAGEITMQAGSGSAAARRASFNMRKDGDAVRVTCLEGDVQVHCRADTLMLRPRQEVFYGEAGLSAVAAVDPEMTTAWQRGLLIFRDAVLSQVVEEINRYRSGRIVLLDEQLRRRHVVATFKLDRIEDAVTFLTQVMKVPARFLPGGIVLLG